MLQLLPFKKKMIEIENIFLSEQMSDGTLSAVGDGRPLGDPTPPLVPLDAALWSSGHHEPLDYSLLDLVDDGVQQMVVTPSSPKDLEILRY